MSASRVGLIQDAELLDQAAEFANAEGEKARLKTVELAAVANDAREAGAQALALAGTQRYATDAEREAAAPAEGTWAYTVATRAYHRRETGRWVPRGDGLASGQQVEEVRSTALGIAARLTSVRSQSVLGTPEPGPAGIIETPSEMMTFRDMIRTERLTYGIGHNAAITSTSNVPGNRTQVTGVQNFAGIGDYGSFDHVGSFKEFVVDPGRHEVPAGAGTYTATTVVLPDAARFGLLRLGMLLRARGPDNAQWYAGVTGWNADTRTIQVNEWRRFQPGGPLAVPPQGALLILNPITKAWSDNTNMLVEPGMPPLPVVIAEWGIVNGTGQRGDEMNGLDLVSLGAGNVNAAITVRTAQISGAWNYGAMIEAATEAGVWVRPDGHGVRPKIDVAATAGTEVGLYSSGGKLRHILCAGPGGVQAFAVEDNGLALSREGFVSTGETGRRHFEARRNGNPVFSVNPDGSFSASVSGTIEGSLEVVGFIDLHTTSIADGDFAVRLGITEQGGVKRLAVNNELVGVRASNSPDTATAAAGSTPSKAEFDALLAELRDLKSKMRASGLLT